MAFTTLTVAVDGAPTDPCARLTRAGGFSLGIDVFAGTMISGDRAFAEVLGRPDRLSCFTEIIATGTNEARMYALAALRELSSAQYQSAVKHLKGKPVAIIRVVTKEQGVLRTESSEAIMKQIDNGMYQREVEFWMKHKLPHDAAWKELASKELEKMRARLRQHHN